MPTHWATGGRAVKTAGNHGSTSNGRTDWDGQRAAQRADS